MAKVVVTQRLHDRGMELLEASAEAVVAETGEPRKLDGFLEDAEGLIIRIGSIDREGLLKAKNLKAVGRPGVGVDNVDVQACTELGIPVVIVPGANTVSVAEHALTLMLALAKDLKRQDQQCRLGNFAIRSAYKAYELRGRKLGLIGGGAIGSVFGQLAQAIGMKIMVYDPYLKRKAVEAKGWEYVEKLDDLLASADVISVHVPLTEQTRHMIGKREFGIMKQDAILINCARGGIIDEEALYEALRTNAIHGAGADVLELEPFDVNSKLMSLDNFIVTPHSAGQTREAATGVATGAVEGVLAVIRGEKWPNVCNPEAYNHPRWQGK